MEDANWRNRPRSCKMRKHLFNRPVPYLTHTYISAAFCSIFRSLGLVLKSMSSRNFHKIICLKVNFPFLGPLASTTPSLPSHSLSCHGAQKPRALKGLQMSPGWWQQTQTHSSIHPSINLSAPPPNCVYTTRVPRAAGLWMFTPALLPPLFQFAVSPPGLSPLGICPCLISPSPTLSIAPSFISSPCFKAISPLYSSISIRFNPFFIYSNHDAIHPIHSLLRRPFLYPIIPFSSVFLFTISPVPNISPITCLR